MINFEVVSIEIRSLVIKMCFLEIFRSIGCI